LVRAPDTVREQRMYADNGAPADPAMGPAADGNEAVTARYWFTTCDGSD